MCIRDSESVAAAGQRCVFASAEQLIATLDAHAFADRSKLWPSEKKAILAAAETLPPPPVFPWFENFLVGGLAGKFMGQQFDPNALKAIGAGMEPNTSALVVIIEDTGMERFAAEMGAPDAQILTVSVGSQLSGELEQVAAIDLGTEVAEVTEAAEAATEIEAPAE